MCGIAGLVSLDNSHSDLKALELMCASVAHRGPDGQGMFVDWPVALGHRRLSIVDLTEAGAQPMKSEDGDLVITYNGEIYNHVELRAELQALGHRFRSLSDTEVILAAYAEWGVHCVSRFNGMWAFAIWDCRRHELFCSRDRFGVKPFYFLELADGFVFGSEIRQLLPWMGRPTAVRERVQEFLLTGMSDHTNGSFFADIRKLPAGHNLFWSQSQRRIDIKRFYRLERSAQFALLATDEALLQYRALFEDAVRLRLRSDVPVGTCLSGGLDSSSVAAVAGPVFFQQSGRPFSAITAISEQEDNSEEALAAEVADQLQLHWLTVLPTYEDLRAQLDAVVKTQEEPFGSASIVMQHAVMHKARSVGIPVLLDGQGGDETLLGYKKYVSAYIASRWRDGGLVGLASAVRMAGKNNASWSPLQTMTYLVGSRLASLRYRYHCWEHRYLRQRPPMPEYLKEFASVCFDDFELQRLEIEKTNLPALLRYEDKNSMAHSIETRLPFLDYRLVEMSLSLPGHLKIRDGWSKWILRQSMSDRLPANVAWRRTKFGFEAPERLWQGAMRDEMLSSIKRSDLLNELVDHRRLDACFDALPLRGQWRLYSVARWAEVFGVSHFA